MSWMCLLCRSPQSNFMQLHLHVLHTKQEMYHLKRCLIGLKAWTLDQDWCEQPLPPLRIIELVAVHTFINASPEDKLNTDALLALCLNRIAHWESLDMVRRVFLASIATTGWF